MGKSNKTTDKEVRRTLIDYFDKIFPCNHDLIIQELGLCQGEARIDIAVINGAIHGFEIKSDRDSLNRLTKQIDIYNKTLDFVTVVCGNHHLPKLKKIIPSWWGLWVTEYQNNSLHIKQVRDSKTNLDIDPNALVQLLWRDEALDLLRELNLHKGFTSKPRHLIWNQLTNCTPIHELKENIRMKIKSRGNWRSDQ